MDTPLRTVWWIALVLLGAAACTAPQSESADDPLAPAPTALTGTLSLDPSGHTVLDLTADRDVVGLGVVEIQSWVDGGESAPFLPDPVIEDSKARAPVRIYRELSGIGAITSPGVLVILTNDGDDDIYFGVFRQEAEQGTALDIAIATELWWIRESERNAIVGADDPVGFALRLADEKRRQPKLSGKSGFRRPVKGVPKVEMYLDTSGNYIDLRIGEDGEVIEKVWVWRYANKKETMPPKYMPKPQDGDFRLDRIHVDVVGTPVSEHRIDGKFENGGRSLTPEGEWVWGVVIARIEKTTGSQKEKLYYQYRTSKKV